MKEKSCTVKRLTFIFLNNKKLYLNNTFLKVEISIPKDNLSTVKKERIKSMHWGGGCRMVIQIIPQGR